MSETRPLPYVREYEDGTLVGAASKKAADSMIEELAKRSPDYVAKASRTTVTNTDATTAYYDAVERIRQAFAEAEGRSPTADDKNYTDSLDELHARFFPDDSRLSAQDPMKKSGGSPQWPVIKQAGGIVASALRQFFHDPTPGSGRLVMGDARERRVTKAAYDRAVEAVRREFVRAEGRGPGHTDENFSQAIGELYDEFYGGR